MHTDISRRTLLKSASLALATAPALRPAFAQSGSTIKIGYVSPQTGPLAAFAEPDKFTLEQLKKATAGGITIGGKKYAVEVVYKDSQSNPNKAGNAAAELITRDKVDLVVASSTPATTNPVADQCELNSVPCITNDTPWQPHFFGRKGNPKVGFEWTYHFFWGLEDVIGGLTSAWSQLDTNKTMGALWPNDEDGNAWGDAKLGFPYALAQKGFKLIDRGRFQSPINDFSSFISEFKKNNVEIVSGVLPPPDFANFWNQAGQQGFRPKIVTVPKATEFPAAISAFGDRADGLTVEVWWSPNHPFSSSMTGQTSKQLAEAYTAATGRPWTMPLGFKQSLFEVALDALKRSADRSPEAIRDAIASTNLNTVVGPVNFKKGPVPNISKTPLVVGQWKKAGKGMELLVVDNSLAPNIPKQAALQAIKYA
ncbi:ABC transporter substrate-binding protein [Hydrogenophaga sp. D2P1]|uniref:ABC transporter substrate-binding protein n=1 Tax=Hydrogenophaga aromaticivorans TaxID=2610898 RepID=A0A7Y8GY73_9BURK|nr:ABC transporter substrate-binding protein [Hydrogenophaga aromaticivorans]NWF47032.1 ABC transporter substrate-binding protein [Hydrogenophaga aromaticivorans]